MAPRWVVCVMAAFLLPVASEPVRACSPYERIPGWATLWTTDGPTAAKHPLTGNVLWGDKPIEDAAVTAGPACPMTPLNHLGVAIMSRVARGSLILMGEVHDNLEHHRLRAGLLPVMPGNSAIVFEQIRADQQAGLDQFADFNTKARRPGTAGDLFRFLDWDNSGWPSSEIYKPLFQAAIDAKLPILAGDPSKETLRAVGKQGEAALAPEERARLQLDQPLAAALAGALNVELKEGHCNLLPDSALPRMQQVQRFRDATLADNLLKAAEKHGSAFLIAGNGHVRTDRGVPWYLRQRAPGRKVVSVMLIEVEDGKTDPQAYVPRDPDGKPAADYILFTPRAERADPCAGLEEKFEKKAG